MINNKKILGLITARSGSKRLPGKNILPFNGKPLISWSIESGLKSKYIDDVVVSTDDNEISRVSIEYGAKVPFMRPQYLAEDGTTSMEVILHALETLSNMNLSYDYLFLLQPTSPLRSSEIIDSSIEYFFEKKADSIIGITKIEHPTEWINQLGEGQSMENFFKSLNTIDKNKESKDSFKINGAVYFSSVEKVLESKALILDSNCFGYIMDKSVSVDIDYELDFLTAEIFSKTAT
jgi:CMP-N,N'-diacetyllegionaminic acid synthase